MCFDVPAQSNGISDLWFSREIRMKYMLSFVTMLLVACVVSAQCPNCNKQPKSKFVTEVVRLKSIESKLDKALEERRTPCCNCTPTCDCDGCKCGKPKSCCGGVQVGVGVHTQPYTFFVFRWISNHRHHKHHRCR